MRAIGDLAPGASAQVTGSYTVTEGDVAGIVNTATAASDQTEPVSDTWTVEVITGPALAIAKVGSATVAKPGDVVDYVLTVTNIGDVTLTNVTVVDAKLGIDEAIGDLAPGASAQVTGSYRVTAADLGALVNTATAASDQTEPVSDTWTVEVAMQPGLVIVKTVNTASAAVGDLITFTLKVTNSGDVPLTDVTISDPRRRHRSSGDLAVGESATMEVPYTVTEADLEDPQRGHRHRHDPPARPSAMRMTPPWWSAATSSPPPPCPASAPTWRWWSLAAGTDIPVKAWVGGTEQETLHTVARLRPAAGPVDLLPAGEHLLERHRAAPDPRKGPGALAVPAGAHRVASQDGEQQSQQPERLDPALQPAMRSTSN